MKAWCEVLTTIIALVFVWAAGCKPPDPPLELTRNNIFLMGRLLAGEACSVRLIWRQASDEDAPVAVTADLSEIGGSAEQELAPADNGTWRWSGMVNPDEQGLKAVTVTAVAAYGSHSTSENTLRVYKKGKAIAIAAGREYGLALKSDGNVLAWSVSDMPITLQDSHAALQDIVAIAAGDAYSLALKADGTVNVWAVFENAIDYYGLSKLPDGLTDIVEVSAGPYHCLALKADGTVIAWGDNSTGVCRLPEGLSDIIAISAGFYNNMALKADGTIVSWPTTYDADVLRDVVAVSHGNVMGLVLRADGTIVQLYINTSEVLPLPFQIKGLRAVSISSGAFSCAALRENGSVAEWTLSIYPGLFFTMDAATAKPSIAIAAGDVHVYRDARRAGVPFPFVLALADDGSVNAWYDTLVARRPLPVPNELR